MNVIISPTGYGPITFEAKRDAYHSQQFTEDHKRGVKLSIWPTVDENSPWCAELVYVTTWGTERSFTWFFESKCLYFPRKQWIRISGMFDFPDIASQIRDAAKSVLPPGAGYPAMPQFETRQAKLQGMLETLTLVALSDVLRQVNDVQQSDTSSIP